MACIHCGSVEGTATYPCRFGHQERNLELCSRCRKGFGIPEDAASPAGATSLEQEDGRGFARKDLVLARFLAPLLNQPGAGANQHSRCESCGKLLSAIWADGLAGCPGCYTCFAQEFEPFLELLHDSRNHRGRDGRR